MQNLYKFSEMSKEHQREIIGNLGRKVSGTTAWVLVPDFPVNLATAMAWDTSVMIHDDDVETVKNEIKRKGKVLRPILIDDLDEDGVVWMEGRHRSIALEELGLKTIPAFVRVE